MSKRTNFLRYGSGRLIRTVDSNRWLSTSLPEAAYIVARPRRAVPNKDGFKLSTDLVLYIIRYCIPIIMPSFAGRTCVCRHIRTGVDVRMVGLQNINVWQFLPKTTVDKTYSSIKERLLSARQSLKLGMRIVLLFAVLRMFNKQISAVESDSYLSVQWSRL